MGRYSSDEIAKRIRKAQAGAWKSLRLTFRLQDSDLRQLVRENGAERLKSLDLLYCAAITDAGVKALAAGCPNLESLDLSACEKITDAGVKALAADCPNLESLDLGWCEKITDAGVKALAAGCPNLESLDLTWCRKITDAGVKALAAGCPNLESLRLVRCWNLRDAGVKALAAACPNLESLELGGCGNITDAGVKALAEGCPNLESLDLALCAEITDAGVKALAAGCPNLKSLDLGHCGKITVRGLASLESRLPPDGKLARLRLSGNTQLGLPEEVIRSDDARAILEAVREILAGAAEPLLAVKIVVLGDGAVGKTQLCNRLRDKPYEPVCDRTADFEVHDLPLKQVGPKGEGVAARLFDFGGQPHLWSAHRFFLASQRNLYVVVIDGTRQKAKDLAYWLRYIRHYAGQGGMPEGRPSEAREKMDIPVLAVVSKCDEATFRELARLPRAVLRDWPRLRVVARYSSKTDDGLPQVRSALRETVAGMDYVFTAQYPKALNRVRSWLEGSEKARKKLEAPRFARSVPVQQFDRACTLADDEAGTRRAADGDYALWLTVLRNLGVVLWLGDLPQVHRGTPLADRVYHPGWVKTLTYGVIRHGLTNGLRQVIGDADLLELMDEAWREAPKEDRRGPAGTLGDGEKRQMIDLMHACRLIFEGTADRRRHWLVLDWIGDTRGVTAGVMQAESSRVTFPVFLPESFLVRFAGRWFTESSGLSDDLFRDQVVVADPAYPDVKAVVRADLAARRLAIRTHGGTPDEQTDVDGKVRGVIERLADREGLAWHEECWVQMAAKRTEGMDYHLYPPFFVVEPQTSFADAWEVFCCGLLNLAKETDRIRRRGPPDEGVDLLWKEKGIAWQCKSVKSGKAGDFRVSEAIKSIRQAIAHREQIGWEQYGICTNVDVTGSQEKKLREVLPDVKLLTPSFWLPRCRRFHEHVYRRFRVLVPMKGGPVTRPGASAYVS